MSARDWRGQTFGTIGMIALQDVRGDIAAVDPRSTGDGRR